MNQNSGSGKRGSKSQPQSSGGDASPPSVKLPAAAPLPPQGGSLTPEPENPTGRENRPTTSAPPEAVRLSAFELTSIADNVAAQILNAIQAVTPVQSTTGSVGAVLPTQPGASDPGLGANPLRDEYKKNIEAHRRKRWYAFWGISIISVCFFALLGIFIFRLLSDDFLPAAIGAASSNWQWHILVFLGAVLALSAAIPLSLAMALVKMISDKEKSDSEGGDLKAPGIELAKAIIELCKSVTSALSK